MKKIIVGILLLLAAVSILLLCMNVQIAVISQMNLSVVEIILCALLIALTICFCIDLNWSLIPFSLMGLFLLLQDNVYYYMYHKDGKFIDAWMVVLCAVIAFIGFSLIVSPIKKSIRRKKNKKSCCAGEKNKDNQYTMHSETKYIDCSDFSDYYLMITMGNGEINFDNVAEYKGNGTLRLECKMGNITVNVPSGWKIVDNIRSKMGNVEMPATVNADGPVLNITGECTMGNIEVQFV